MSKRQCERDGILHPSKSTWEDVAARCSSEKLVRFGKLRISLTVNIRVVDTGACLGVVFVPEGAVDDG